MAGSGSSEQGVFISYRRADTRADAGRLYDRLSTRFGTSRVFMDIDDIQPGQNFETVLQDTLGSCSVLLVLIGRDWLSAADANGQTRLQDESDLVRREVAIALGRGIPVIPLLFNRAQMPTAGELPAELARLASLQAHEISDSRFHDDVNVLEELLAPLVETAHQVLAAGAERPADTGASTPPSEVRNSRLPIFALLAVGVVIVLWFLNPFDRAEPPEPAPEVEMLSLRAEPVPINDVQLLESLVEHNLFDARRNPAGAGTPQLLDLVLVGEQAVLVDRGTGLMWQQNGTARQQPLAEAELQLHEMNEQGFAGFSDWRLPTLEEAVSLLTPDKQGGAHVSPLLSPSDTPVIWTADRAGDRRAWALYFYDGAAAPESLQFNAWLRAVRSHR